jgi:putative DNA primase/helicase
MTDAPKGPYVPTKAIYAAVKGKEGEILDGMGVAWRAGHPHVRCPYPDHADSDPSWRFDAAKGRAFCTCIDGYHGIFDIMDKVLGLDFEAAKIRAAELIGRPDLIRQTGTKGSKTDAASLLAPPAGKRHDGLVAAYLAHRLGVPRDAVPMPSTPIAGWAALAYHDKQDVADRFPTRLGDFPCAVFGMIGPDGKQHAHRIYLAPGGEGKADLGLRPDGTVRDVKKSARAASDDRVAGRCVSWGNAERATTMIVTEGIETAVAVALLFHGDIEAGTVAVAAAISAPGMTQFQPWPATRRLLIAADRDEAAKASGAAGSRAGERAARKLVERVGGTLDQVSILLPGVPGESVDWLDVLRRDGLDTLRTAFANPPTVTPAAEIEPDAPAEADNVVPFRPPGSDVSSPAKPGKTAGVKPAKAKAKPGGTSRYRLTDRGVERLVEFDDKEAGETRSEWKWFGSPLEIMSATRDSASQEWGLLLKITDKDRCEHLWPMPMAMLAGDGTAYRERLFSLGFVLAPGKTAKDALHEYLATARPEGRARCVSRIGWHGERFVLPDGLVFAAPNEADEAVFLQGAAPLDHAYRVAGTFEDWQRDVAAKAIGNSRLLLALSIAFAAPLLHLIGQEGGGFHLRGASSIGKSTALLVAGSAWGGGGVRGYVRSWRSTDNGLESTAAAHCDAPLLLDELAQVTPEAAGATAYMLAAGAGKVRAGRHGEGRAAAEWRTLFLSNGEISLAAKIEEDGRGRRAMAGQAVRVVDLPADAGAGFGMFEQLHGFASADAFARHLKAATAGTYGHGASKFLEAIVRDIPGTIEAVRQVQAGFTREQCPAGCDGQVTRVAQRFGLVAAAGELATALGVMPWPAGEARAGLARCFAAWLAVRGGAGSAEEMEAVAKVRRFLEQHGTARFERIGDEPANEDEMVKASRLLIRDRVGFRRENPNGNYFYVLPESWKEVCGGCDPAMTAKALTAREMLWPDSGGKSTRPIRLPISKKPVRCYVLLPKIFEGTEGG